MEEKKENPENEAGDTAEVNEVISKKKVIYIEIDDEVTVIYEKLKKIPGEQIYIVCPKRAVLFQSVVNLKILKRKAEDDGKKIFLITNDTNGMHLAQKVGIEVFDKANEEGRPAIFSSEVNDERLRITPLKASVNSVEDEAPTRLTERKLSISEILRKKRGRKDVDITKMESVKKVKKESSRFVLVTANRHALFAFLSVSTLILFFILYIALPGATIYITPSADKLEKSVNITLADYQKNQAEIETSTSHIIPSYPIDTTVSKTITHVATGKKFSDKGANSSGLLTVYNTTNNEWPLIPETRFQTDEGLVFRIKDNATVPAATSKGPGQLEVFVIADQVDAFGAITGARGNIEASRFFLPGLKEDSRGKLYGESKAKMTGGVTDYITYITAEDIEAAKLRLQQEIVKSAVKDLELAVQEKSALLEKSGVFVLLQGENAVRLGDVQISVDESLIDKQLESFEVSGQVNVTGVYYLRDEMMEILVDELTMKKSPQKELVRVSEESTTYRIFEWDEQRGKIKLTANIKGIEQYEIDPKKENGANLLEKIKSHIVGENIENAKVYIQNLPEINKVEIDSWPAWSPTIPSIPDNIEFEIRDAIMPE